MTATAIAQSIAAQADPFSFDLPRFWALHGEMTGSGQGGSGRLSSFAALPPDLQTIAFRALGSEIERGR
jgi:hypothetical protein